MKMTLYKDPDLMLSHGVYPVPDLEGENRPSLHAHTRYCEILCIFRGKGNIHVAGNHYSIADNSFILTRPGEPHYAMLDPSSPYDRAVIYFTPSLLDSIDPERRLLMAFFERESGFRNQYIPESAEAMKIMRQILSEPSRLNIILGMLSIFQLFSQMFLVDKGTPTTQTLEHRIVQYINENPQLPHTTESLCARFHISRAPLYRRFKKVTGTSVGEYINSRRVLLAQQMLAEGQKPMDVCYKCGFQDYSTFFRAYRKHLGHSPSTGKGETLI